jgi:glycosyltransferase involved in cell wall biosynthesis
LSKNLLFIGVLPTPVHGASQINRLAVGHLKTLKFDVKELDTYSLSRSTSRYPIPHMVTRALRCVSILIYLISNFKSLPKSWYISLSGGGGLIFDLIYALCGRGLGVSMIMHHHSYAYLNNHSILFSLITKVVGGPSNQHIFLSPEMKTLALKRYPNLAGSINTAVSNVGLLFGFLKQTSKPPRSTDKSFVTIGYLANITKEKGAHDFLDLADTFRNDTRNIKFVMAGPCEDLALLERIEIEKNRSTIFSYIGSVYGEDKANFFSEVDLFVFPSRYRNEAEPLVLIEAGYYGCEILSTDIGSISEMASYLNLSIVPAESNLKSEVEKFLHLIPSSMPENPEINLRKKSINDLRLFESLFEELK